jgi:hypothetical protein
MSISDEFLDAFEDEDMLKLKKKEITPIIKSVKEFFIKNDIVLYGGTAMNMYLPKRLQFYSTYDIPDYDGFHENARSKSVDLIDMLKKEKYDFLIAKHAIHDGTYKVSWVFKDIADITNVNQYDYKHILNTRFTHKKSGLSIVNINLLKSNSYVELAMPKSSSFRWSKVYKRLMLLEQSHKVTSKLNILKMFDNKIPAEIQEIADTVYEYINENRLPLVGLDAVKYFIDSSNKNKINELYHTSFTMIEILSDSIYETMKQIKTILSRMKMYDEFGKHVHVEYDELHDNKSQLIPNTVEYIIHLPGRKCKFLKIYDVSTKCISVTRDASKKNSFVYGSIFFILYIYYFMLCINDNKRVKRVYNGLIETLLPTINQSNFTTECYGFSKSISVIKKSRVLKNFKNIVAKS